MARSVAVFESEATLLQALFDTIKCFYWGLS